METSFSQSILETLPDEMLLEVCKYLLCTDILQSFVGLNDRMTRMITQYRHHVSLHKTSFSTFNSLYENIFPQIGSQIRSLFIDCCYSILQDELFIKYFGKKMSLIFPKLERISLSSYMYDQLVAFLNVLHDLNRLVEIRLYYLFPIQSSDQPTLVRSLAQANNHRFTTILIDDQSSCLSFDDTNRYFNILQLRIKLRKPVDLPYLFAAVPNVHYLDVVIEGRNGFFEYLDENNFSPLLHLTNFRLKCSIIHHWMLEQLIKLLIQLPIVQNLSIFLSTKDRRLVEGNILLPSLPSTIQQFNYAIHLYSVTPLDRADEIIASWPPSHPITCFFNDRYLFLHTLPWHYARIEFSALLGKMMSCCANNATDYDRNVEQLNLQIDRNFTLTRSLAMISQCRRVREIIINVTNDGDAVKEEQLPVLRLSKLSRLIHVCFLGSLPSDLNSFSFILNAAPNLFRLDLPFDYLLRLIEDQQICHLLGQRITSLSIYDNDSRPSSVTLNEEHIPIIASVFPRIRDLYVILTHLPRSTTLVSNENIPEDPMIRNLSVELCQQKYEVVSPFSSESMLLCLLTKFKEHKLIGLCVDGQFLEELKMDTEQWLRHNTILHERQFEAVFNIELNRILIYM